jgi:hypothetical protein
MSDLPGYPAFTGRAPWALFTGREPLIGCPGPYLKILPHGAQAFDMDRTDEFIHAKEQNSTEIPSESPFL